LSCTGGYLGGKDVLFEEILADRFFHVPPEALVVDSLVFFSIVIRSIFFCSGECRVILDRPRDSPMAGL